ncbi:hypothetical protein ACWEOW_14680 [Monashia sp. NPDC004114]
MKLHKGMALAAIGLTAAFVASASPASADPVGDPVGTYRPLAGMGSDTTFEVMNGLSEVVVINGSKAFGSYDPTPANQLVSTKTEAQLPNCNTTNGGGTPRANGSGAGRDLLTKAMTPTDPLSGCIDFARSSSTSVNANQTFVPMASDGLTYAYPNGGDIGSSSSLSDLQLIYKCDPSIVGTFQPLIPQSGSGTRTSWATLMGINATTLPSCVKDTIGGVPIQEHSGLVLTSKKDIVPISVAQYLSQMFGVVPDRRGSAQLGTIDGVSPLIQNPAQTTLRTVGNILPTQTFNDTASLGYKVFVNDGSGKSALCTQGKAVINKFGFIPSTC